MKALFLIVAIVLLLGGNARAQVDVRQQQTDEVRAIVQSFGSRPTKVSLLTRSLVFSSGKIVATSGSSFHLKFKKRVIEVPYENVLAIEGSGKSVTFIPDRATLNHGSWDDVGRIYPGTKILVVYSDKKAEIGFSNSVSKTHLIMVDKNGRERVDVPADRIVAVYGLIGGYGGVKAGASKGAEGMTNDRDVLLDGIFAGVGALVGMVKSDGRPILIYSR